MRFATSRLWERYFNLLRGAALLGALLGMVVGAAAFEPPLLGAAVGSLSGFVDAMAMMMPILAAELFVPRTPLGGWLSGRPFLVGLWLKVSVYTAIIVVVVGGYFGPTVAMLALDAETARSVAQQMPGAIPARLLVPMATVTVMLSLLLHQAVHMVGERTARAISLGRYHRPRPEERFFLFIDIVGSTPVAERLGALSVHRYLNRIFQETADPIDDHGGDVYQYVGDEIVVTWLVPQARAGARPLGCLFAIEAALLAAASEFEREFGIVPRLRAALHAGEVVTGVAGGSRRAIVFHGDVMNATSRIEDLTRTLGHAFLVSEDALARMDGADAWTFSDLGPHELRGKQAPVRIYAVAPRQP